MRDSDAEEIGAGDGRAVIWFLIPALVAAIMVLSRRLVRNCSGCKYAIEGPRGYICLHPKAVQAPEFAQIQAGHWRCPWRERLTRRNG